MIACHDNERHDWFRHPNWRVVVCRRCLVVLGSKESFEGLCSEYPESTVFGNMHFTHVGPIPEELACD